MTESDVERCMFLLGLAGALSLVHHDDDLSRVMALMLEFYCEKEDVGGGVWFRDICSEVMGKVKDVDMVSLRSLEVDRLILNARVSGEILKVMQLPLDDGIPLFAELRLTHDSLEPSVITEELQIPPDFQVNQNRSNLVRCVSGDVVSESYQFSGNRWCINSQRWVKGPGRSLLQTHVLWVVNELRGKEHVLERFMSGGVSVELYCVCGDSDGLSGYLSDEVTSWFDKLGIEIIVHPFHFGG